MRVGAVHNRCTPDRLESRGPESEPGICFGLTNADGTTHRWLTVLVYGGLRCHPPMWTPRRDRVRNGQGATHRELSGCHPPRRSSADRGCQPLEVAGGILRVPPTKETAVPVLSSPSSACPFFGACSSSCGLIFPAAKGAMLQKCNGLMAWGRMQARGLRCHPPRRSSADRGCQPLEVAGGILRVPPTKNFQGRSFREIFQGTTHRWRSFCSSAAFTGSIPAAGIVRLSLLPVCQLCEQATGWESRPPAGDFFAICQGTEGGTGGGNSASLLCDTGRTAFPSAAAACSASCCSNTAGCTNSLRSAITPSLTTR